VQQVSAEQSQLQEAQVQIAALEAEKSSLKDQLAELTQRLESVEQLGDPTANSLATRRLEFRAKELESKLELEQTTRARLEVQRLVLKILSRLTRSRFVQPEISKMRELHPDSSFRQNTSHRVRKQ
jgi:capsule polysaccharide export protein KpsE/RkpR